MATPQHRLLNSTYHKVRDLLTVLAPLSEPSLSGLVTAIHAGNLDSFCYWAARSKAGDRRTACSPAAVRRAIRTAESLGLLTVAGEDGPCRLAADGEDALRQDRFNAVLAKVALRRLEALGYASDALSREMKAIQLPELPDLPTLYARRPPAANGLSKADFGRLMMLVAESGTFRVATAQLFFAG